jgi:hypothetical protein
VPAPAPPPPIRSLERALERVTWDPARRGALLAVDPAGVRLSVGDAGLPPDGNGFTLRAAAAPFRRKVVTTDTLTVLAPVTMQVWNARPGKPDLLADLQPHEKILLFLDSLSAAQWRLLGSERGLGAADFVDSPTRQQRALFLSLLPDPFPVRRIRMVALDGGRTGTAGDPPFALTPEQRAGVRIRLRRVLHVSFPMAGNAGSGSGSYIGLGSDAPQRPAGDSYYSTQGAVILAGGRPPSSRAARTV